MTYLRKLVVTLIYNCHIENDYTKIDNLLEIAVHQLVVQQMALLEMHGTFCHLCCTYEFLLYDLTWFLDEQYIVPAVNYGWCITKLIYSILQIPFYWCTATSGRPINFSRHWLKNKIEAQRQQPKPRKWNFHTNREDFKDYSKWATLTLVKICRNDVSFSIFLKPYVDKIELNNLLMENILFCVKT